MKDHFSALRRRLLLGFILLSFLSEPRSAQAAKALWFSRNCCLFPRLVLPWLRHGLSVSLHPPEGGHYSSQARLILTNLTNGVTKELMREKGDHVYLGEVSPGVYRLEVCTLDFAPQSVLIEVGNGTLMHCIYLGKKGWPTFNYGTSRIPFEPHFDKVAIVFRAAFWEEPGSIQAHLPALAKIGLVPFDADTTVDIPYIGGGASILFLRTHDGTSIFATNANHPPLSTSERLFDSIRKVFPSDKFGQIRIGVPISATKGRIRILDNQFVVQFNPSLNAQEILALSRDLKFEFTPVPFFPGFWTLRFGFSSNYLAHLRIVDELINEGILLTGEPNLFFDLVNAAMTDPPEAWFACQEYIARQRIPNAWNQPSGYGKPEIVVATLDSGINLFHHDVNLAALTCVDVKGAAFGAVTCGEPSDGHGMHIYGIIAAPHNGIGIAGIAPNTTHIAVVRPAANVDDSRTYASMLKWLAKLDNSHPVDSNGEPYTVAGNPISWPSSPPVDIINCSHIWAYLPLPIIVTAALHDLVTRGRNGLGCVIVCAAGNSGTEVQGETAFAMSPCTMIVGNTADDEQSNWTNGAVASNANEVKDPLSNTGRRLDLCAFGGHTDGWRPNAPYSNAAITLNKDNSTTPNLFCHGEQATGLYQQGMTSIATAMVSSVAALVLSANPLLKWHEVRAVLRGSASKIDRNCNDQVGQWWKRSGIAWIPDPPPVGTTGLDYHSRWYGYGRLDATQAVTMAVSNPLPIEAKKCCPTWPRFPFRFPSARTPN